MTKSKKSIFKTVFALLMTVMVVASSVQIYRVNHAQDLTTYRAKQVIYDAGEVIPLPDEVYYLDMMDLSGYQMKITGTKLLTTENFLKQYNLTYQDLDKNSIGDGDYGLIYLVDTEFQNTNNDKENKDAIFLENFMLVGADNTIGPATSTINTIPGFNPSLKGNSAFAIQSDKTLHVTIPYLIQTTNTGKYTAKELLKDPPKLLIAEYPEEIYGKLPEPDTKGL